MFLAVMTAVPITIFPTVTYAQTTGGVGQTVANGLAAGQTPAQLAAGLAGQGGASAAQWTSMLQGLQTNGASASAITGLVNGVVAGTIPPSVGAALREPHRRQNSIRINCVLKTNYAMQM